MLKDSLPRVIAYSYTCDVRTAQHSHSGTGWDKLGQVGTGLWGEYSQES